MKNCNGCLVCEDAVRATDFLYSAVTCFDKWFTDCDTEGILFVWLEVEL